MRSLGAVILGYLLIIVGIFSLPSILTFGQREAPYNLALFLGLWIFGGLIAWYGSFPTKEKSTLNLELKPPESKPQMIREEVIRKEVIVKIRCPYCNNVYDETLDRCPYCGAKR